ncbi:uncharacterized protein LOC130612454 [Hydractinia symbiolongicarpus]|uniref:uncharacterized protein LOC130612454 n=1 Tax=Hydractinia symbiolongicarpus TaxID=13093 RepID=UPI00254B1147|nr:uncharacterized protein LOC130612454 [Hydractinia symbiolongicarpus]
MHLLYRPPAGSIENFENHVKNILTDHKGTGRNVYLVGDFNLNVLDFNTNKSVQNFFNSVFQNGFIPLINKPTRVTRLSATAIDHIITNDFTNTTIKTGIIKTDISDHFPIFITYFDNLLYCVDWSLVLENNNADKAYEIFLQTFQQQYDQAFPEQTTFVKTKTLLNPWLTKGLLKSSKKKQRFGLINKHKNDAKKTWSIINEVIGKTTLSKEKLPKRLNIDGNKIENKCLIAEELNYFFVKVGSNLASQIGPSNLSFKSFLTVNNAQMENNELRENELFKAIDSLQSNKSPGFDDVNSNVVKQTKNAIKIPLMHIFNLFLLQGYFPEKLKIARVLPVYKTGEKTNASNYRPISVLPCFSKILERIMYNRFYSFLTANNILYDNQFGFQAGHSTDHAIVKLVNEISKAFDENKYMLGIFINLSKAFDTVDHKILLEKLKNYGIRNSNICWHNKKDDMPLKFPDLSINNISIKRAQSMKFLGVILDENVTWREHINILEEKVAKNIAFRMSAVKVKLENKALVQKCEKITCLTRRHCLGIVAFDIRSYEHHAYVDVPNLWEGIIQKTLTAHAQVYIFAHVPYTKSAGMYEWRKESP